MTSEQKRTCWTGHFEAWLKSNLTQSKYCEQHNRQPSAIGELALEKSRSKKTDPRQYW
jgi:hypothetical protein